MTARIIALGVDLALLVVFAAIGRRSHAEGISLSGVLSTAWPFFTGALIGHLIALATRQAPFSWQTGVLVWISAIAIGMALRALTHQGVAVSFVIVASSFVGIVVMGWRLLARVKGAA